MTDGGWVVVTFGLAVLIIVLFDRRPGGVA